MRFIRAAVVLSVLVIACDQATEPVELRTRPTYSVADVQYQTGWLGYVLGAQPMGWSQAWDGTPHFKVVSEAGSTDGRVLEWNATGQSRDRWGLAYDGLGELTDQEVYTEFRVRSMPAPQAVTFYMGSAAVRISGTNTQEQGYAVFFTASPAGQPDGFALSTWVNGAYNQLAALSFVWTVDTWYSVRLRAVGAQISARIWPRGTVEPTTWQLSAVDSRYGAGRPGVSHHDNGSVQWDTWQVTGTPVNPPPPTLPAGAQLLTFEGATVGAAPAGWTETAFPSASDWTVVADSTVSDSRVLRNVTTSTDRHILRMNVSADTATQQEILVRIRMRDEDDRGAGVALRHSMTNGRENGYVAYLRSSSDALEINRFVNGGWSFLAVAPFENHPGAWYWLRFRADGAALRVKAWPDGASEPAGWTREITDSALPTGSAGLYVYEPNTIDYDAVGYAPYGGTAPAPSGTAVAPRLDSIALSPRTAQLAPGAQQAFVVTGHYSDGQSMNIAAAFTATGGTITNAGVFTAGPTEGTYRVVASAVAGTIADTALVTVANPVGPPALVYQDGFNRSVVGLSPPAWSETSVPDNSSWAVVADSTVTDARMLRNTTTSTGRHILRLNNVPDTTTQQEFLVRIRLADGDDRGPGIALRHTMSGTSESAYVAYLRPGSDQVEINRFVSGSWGFVAARPFGNNPGSWYWLRFRADGASLRVRVWPDASAEPASWTVEATDQALTAGSAGLYTYEPNTIDFDGIGFAARGGTAPSPAQLTQLLLNPANSSLTPGGSAQFTAQGVYSDGFSGPVAATFQASGGSITNAGLFRAGSTPGNFTVVAQAIGALFADTSAIAIAALTSGVIEHTFASGTVGAAPTGWTETQDPANSDWTIQNIADAVDGRALRNVTTSTGRHILRLDAVPDSTTQQEVLVRIRMGDGDDRGPGIALRHRMNGTRESAYVAYLRPGGDLLEINRFVDGGWAFVAAVPFQNNPGVWYWLRFRADGSSLRARGWADGSAEPTTWHITATDASLPAGTVGLYTYEPNVVDYDAVVFAGRGETALPPGGAVLPPPQLERIEISPSQVTLAPGATQTFSARGYYTDGSNGSVSVVYTAAGGTITSAGQYTAGSVNGEFRVIASVASGSADTALVTVLTPVATATSLSFTFAEYALGAHPAGWTETSAPANSDWIVTTDSTALDGTVLRNVTTATGRHILAIDGVSATATDQEVLTRIRLENADDRGPGVALRHTMNGTSETAYVAYLRSGGQLEINRFLNSGWAGLGAAAFPNTPGTWYWLRFKAEGSVLRAKAWADGTPEPSTWNLTVTDSGIAAGRPGAYVYEPNTVSFDVLAVSIGTHAAAPRTFMTADLKK